MYVRFLVVTLAGAPLGVLAQQPSPPPRPDSAARDIGPQPRADSARRPVRLTEVTVVATPADRAAPSSAIRLGPLVIRTTPGTSPWDLLRQTAGVEVHEQGQGPGFASDASVRGFSSDHSTDLALWIDGVPVNEPVNGHAEGYNDWSLLFPAAVRDIDVVKGPTSALFGNFALSGVVNVRTVERIQGTEAMIGVGSPGLASGIVLTGFDHGARGGGVVGVRGAHDNGWRPNSASDLGQVHARLLHDLTATATIDAGVELYGAAWNSPGYLGEGQFARGDYGIVSNPSDGGFKRRAQERVSLRLLTGPFLWRSTAYATEGLWRFYLTVPPAGGRFEGMGSQTEEVDNRTGTGLTSALTWAFAGGDVTVGGESRWDRTRYQNWFTTVRTRDSAAALLRASQLSGALFVQTNYDVGARIHTSVGGRYDILSTRSQPDGAATRSATTGVLSPKLGLLVRVTEGVGLYGNVSRGFRSTDGVIADPGLAPITAWAYESGTKLDRGGASASVALFRVDVSHEQTFNPLTRGAASGGASRRQGAELDLRAPLGPVIALSADWTFTDARYTTRLEAPGDPAAPPVVLSGRRVYNTAKYVGSGTLTLTAPSAAWHLRVGGNWVGPYSPFDEPGVVTAGYGLAHLGADLEVGAVRLDIGLRNVLDRAYPELIAAHIVAPGRPRSATVEAAYRF